MDVEINDYELDINSKMQRFVYRCLSMFGPGAPKRSRQDKQKLMDAWCRLFQDTDFRLVFDESLWMPDEPDAYENVAMLQVHSRMGTTKMVTIDFRDTWHPIFNINYVMKNVEEQA